ncbi:MAG: CaiB/BaiF CoA-transferase family protein [Acidimicrobiia bacterium]
MGPLQGVKVIELAGIGPGPFAGTLLSDMGADVVRVERADWVDKMQGPYGFWVDGRGRRSVGVDLKHPDGVETVLRLVEQADVLIEGYRPGVTERLGLGPDDCMARNPRLVYGRMTGWGQAGPLANAAGHDINYISVAGALAHFGRAGQPPTPPLNMVGDYGGGGMFLAFGIVCALFEAKASGEGQVVDAAMVDGAAYLMGPIWGLRNMGGISDERGTNLLDTGAPFYDAYETSDGKWVSIGSIEPQFYAELLERLGIDPEGLPHQNDRAGWPAMKERLTAIFETKTRDEWCAVLEGTDVCFGPILTMTEAAEHPHIKARGTVVNYHDILQPAPAPRFSRTAAEIQGPAVPPGENTDAVLASFGFSAEEIASLRDSGAVKQKSR